MRNNLSQLISLSKVAEKLYRPADAFELSRVTRSEHVNTTIYETPQEGIASTAAHIAKVIRDRAAVGKKVVLSLASGRSMRDLFTELVRLHKEEGLSFKNVVVFGSYEFYPLADLTSGSMAQIQTQLLNHIDILPENVHTFPGDLPRETIFTFCEGGTNNVITDWTKWDLSVLGEVVSIQFNVCGDNDNNYGFSQPAYLTYDDVAVRFPK